jgi:hypothetical protein
MRITQPQKQTLAKLLLASDEGPVTVDVTHAHDRY